MSDSNGSLADEENLQDYVYGNGRPPIPKSVGPMLTVSSSFKSDGKSKKKSVRWSSLEEDEFLNLLHESDPVKVELNRLENEVRGILKYYHSKHLETGSGKS